MEGTAHTLGIGLARDSGEIVANAKSEYVPKLGGIHPREAAQHHGEELPGLLSSTLKESGVGLGDLDLIAFSRGPGLGPCLRTVATASRALALYLDLPLVGVNHCVSHIEIGKQATGCGDPVTVYVSGGSTQILAHVGGRYRVFGETQDIALGNALDTFARDVGIAEFPGAKKVEEIARGGAYVHLPYTVKGTDLSFSGLVTHAVDVHRAGRGLSDVCFSIQEVAFAMLTEVAERALAHTAKTELLLTGGVAANRRLQNMLETMCGERECDFHVVPFQFAMDNGAMIAWNGIKMYESGDTVVPAKSQVRPKWRTDQVVTRWIKA
jgi:N6-L-threonylcarbamoyladenine synthase/protein kinase Bud32